MEFDGNILSILFFQSEGDDGKQWNDKLRMKFLGGGERKERSKEREGSFVIYFF